jgi:hypothetical protein
MVVRTNFRLNLGILNCHCEPIFIQKILFSKNERQKMSPKMATKSWQTFQTKCNTTLRAIMKKYISSKKVIN